MAIAAVMTLAASGAVALSASRAAAAVVEIPCVSSGSAVVTCEYSDGGNIGRFTVPEGVESIDVGLRGGAGGNGADPAGPGGTPGAGGTGGQATAATLAVSEGDVLDAYLGAGGEDGTQCDIPSAGSDYPGGDGGISGGIAALSGGKGGSSGFYCAGGGGGGASYLMRGRQDPRTAAPRLAAGGGGGGGGSGYHSNGSIDYRATDTAQDSAIDLNGGNGGRGGPGGTDGADGGGGEYVGLGGDRGEDGGKGNAGENGERGRGGAGQDGGGGGGGGQLGGEGGRDGGGGGGGCGGPGCPQPTEDLSAYRATAVNGGLTIVYSLPASSGPTKTGGGGPSSNDPNPNTNRQGNFPKPLPGMDPATTTALCRPGKTCTVNPPPGVDSRFRIDAAGGNEEAVLFGTTNGTYRAASLEKGSAGRPDCPDYRERNSDWVQFGFLQAQRGSTWRKQAVMTQRQKLKESAAESLADEIQICFAAPYAFPTREGYRLGRSGPDRVGVLPECGSSRARSAKPCVATREIVKVKGGWVVSIAFEIPANAKDPKALG